MEDLNCKVMIAKDEEKEVRCSEPALYTVSILETEGDENPLIVPVCKNHLDKYESGKSLIVIDPEGALWLIGSHIQV